MKPIALFFVGWLFLTASVSAQLGSSNETLTLAGILKLALRHSPAIAAAKFKADSLHSAAKATRDSSGLSLTSSAGFLYDPVEEKRLIPRSSLEELTRDEAFNSTIFDARITLSWPILAKNIGYRADAEDAAAKAADSGIALVRHRVYLLIVRNYYQLLMLNQAVKTAEASIEALKETKRQVKRKIEVGRAPPIDLFRINSRLSRIELDLLSFSNERRKRGMRLEELAGVDFADGIKFTDELRQPEANFEEKVSIQFAVRERPEAKSAVFFLKAARARKNVVNSVFSPKIRFFLEPSLNYGDNAQKVVNDAIVGVRITWPLYDPAYSARKDQALASIKASNWRLKNVRRKLQTQVRTALLDLNKARKSIAVTKKLIKTAREAFRAEQARYKAGFSTVNNVLEAQAVILQAELASARSLMEYNVARTHVFWARGDMTIENLSP